MNLTLTMTLTLTATVHCLEKKGREVKCREVESPVPIGPPPLKICQDLFRSRAVDRLF